jgi:hypothetical protein
MTFPERYRWPSLAREWVHAGNPVPVLERGELLKTFDMEEDELERVVATPEFQALVHSVRTRTDPLGALAPQVFRVEEMLGPLSERLYQRLKHEDCKIDEYVKGFLALIRSAGLDQPVQTGTSNAAVAVQINLPVLDSDKLRHVGGTVTVHVPEEKEELP